jgi:hypothetical protein
MSHVFNSSVFHVQPSQICALNSQTGVHRLGRLIREGGWRDSAGSLIVTPAAEDKKQFADCIEHFNAMQQLSKQIYSMDTEEGKHRVQYEGFNIFFWGCNKCNDSNVAAIPMNFDKNKAKFIVWGCRYVIVDGHHRRHALLLLRDQQLDGLPELVRFVNLSSNMYFYTVNSVLLTLVCVR